MKHKNLHKSIILILPLSFLLLLSSCFGVNADIILNANGSGTVNLEYRVSKDLDSLGKLDGNERWNTIPVGKADFERTMDRLPDMKLVSFSSKEDEKNVIVTAKMGFANLNGLLAFLDSGGKRSSFSGDIKSGRITLTLNDGRRITDPDLDKLIAGISDGYTVSMSMTFPSDGNLALKDNQGNVRQTGSEFIPKGKTVSFSLPLYEVLTSSGGLSAEFSW
ncbi:MAG: hypothetical protein FWF26_02280 [Treponema sp.]|nr:hypothetical protein [Treponema sp.]